MKDDVKIWLQYSEENLQSATLLLESDLFNPCLQNVQQCVEKAPKAILIENSHILKKTHDILELKVFLDGIGIKIDLTEDECDFLNSIYLSSKYPIGSALPDYDPEIEIVKKQLLLRKKSQNPYSNIFIK